jgi:hypothetical protein
MRKFLGSAFALTLTAALVVGLAFAWTGVASSPASPSTIGSVSVVLQIDSYTGLPLLPNISQKTATGRVGNNTGVPVYMTTGSITGINVPANTGCNGYVSGSVTITDSSSIATGTYGGGWDSYLALLGSTPNACESLGVDYTINVEVSTF